MNNLTIINKNGQLFVDSREVAVMLDKRHDHLLRDIEGYVSILNQTPILGSDQTPNLRADNFFIESSYKSGTGKAYKCYLLTKKGCEMVANKMTGEKGVLFTAAYVTQFEAMENHIKQNTQVQVTIDKSKDLEIKKQAIEAKHMNATARLEAIRLKKMQFQLEVAKAFHEVLSPEMKQVVATKLLNDSTGENLLPLPQTEKVYSCEEIADELNLFSKNGKPHKQLISAIISDLKSAGEIKENIDYIDVLESKGGWTGTTTKYKKSVIEKIKTYCESLNLNGSTVELKNKRFNLLTD